MDNLEDIMVRMTRCVVSNNNAFYKIMGYDINKDQIVRMVQMALFNYLFFCFETDKNITQTAYNMAKQKNEPEQLEYSRKLGLHTKGFEELKASLERCTEKIYENILVENKKAMKDERIRNQLRREVKRDRDVLMVADWIANDQLKMLDMLWGRKQPMRTMTADVRKKGNYGLKDAYTEFDKLLERIHKKEYLKSEEYVTACFSLYKLEYTYRFIMYGEIAKYMNDHQLALDKIPSLFDVIVKRIPSDDTLKYSPIVMDYAKIIKCGFIYDSCDLKSSELSAYYYMMRLVVKYSVCEYRAIGKRPEWTEEFYKQVEDFMYTCCCVTGAFKKIELEKCDNSGKNNCYDYLRMLYIDSPLSDRVLLEKNREKYLNIKKCGKKENK